MAAFIIIWITITAAIMAYQIYGYLKKTGVAQAWALERRLSRRGNRTLLPNVGRWLCSRGYHKMNHGLLKPYCSRGVCDYGPLSKR